MTIKETAGNLGTAAKDKLETARTTATDVLSSARDRASDLATTARDRAGGLATSARDTASTARMKTSDGIDANPVAALIGGLALGALAAAVLPRTRKEDELLGGIGEKINDSARTAAQAAKDAGRDKLDELGINKDAAMEKAKELAQSASTVVKESATAAASSVKSS
ncbi:MAG TPA: hypothetical protein VEZ48_07920 [Sphingomonadaceae bacterium]|nr:hypothetical protein [Sphingomonadaceae bacterium]